MKHRHHIVPRHAGGDDSSGNLTAPISIAEHAELHRELWLRYGQMADFIAWKALSGRMTSEEARLAAAKAGQEKSEAYRRSRLEGARHLQAARTPDSCSKGGRAASVALVEWQRRNKTAHSQQCAANARAKGPSQQIRHEYLSIIYPSKKALQAAHSMSNCGFYGKLNRGDIKRLREIAGLEKP